MSDSFNSDHDIKCLSLSDAVSATVKVVQSCQRSKHDMDLLMSFSNADILMQLQASESGRRAFPSLRVSSRSIRGSPADLDVARDDAGAAL